MKLTILLPDLRGGGVERLSLDLAHEFKRIGHEVELALMSGRGELLEEARDNFSVVDLRAPRARSLPRPLVRYLRGSRPRAIIAGLWPLTVLTPIATKLACTGCKVLVSEHNNLSTQYGDWGAAHRLTLRGSMRISYPLAYARVAVSHGVAADMSRLSGLPLQSFDVIYNPVAMGAVALPQEIERAENGWGLANGKRIISVGSFKKQKNHSLLIRAFARLGSPDATLMILGDGSLRTELKCLASELGVSDRVMLPGFHSDPTPFYQTADLFVMSSDYEGFGNVIVEALATGTPVVSTDCPSGPAEILENGKWGRLTPVGDEVALAGAIKAALEDEYDPEALKRRAADFSPEIAARKYLEALDLT